MPWVVLHAWRCILVLFVSALQMFPDEKTPAPKTERQSLVLIWRNDEVNGWIIHDGYSIDPYCIVTHCNIVTQCHAVSCQWCQHLKFYKSLSLFSVVWDFGVHPHDSNILWTLDYEGMKATWKDKLMRQTLGEWCWARVQELFLPNVLMFWRHSTRNRNVCKRNISKLKP